MSVGVHLWEQFVANGLRAATGIDRAVHDLAPSSMQPTELGELALECYNLASQCLLLGTEELGRLALACERGLDALSANLLSADDGLPDIAAAARTVRLAFEQLAAPDKSGARIEGIAVDAARETLERMLRVSRADRPLSGATERAAAAAARAAAATATMAAAAVARSSMAAKAAGSMPPPSEAVVVGPGGATTGDPDLIWQPQVDEDMIEMFFEEANERLEGLAEKLVELEQRPDDQELVHEIFRDLHTVKGSSAMVGLRKLNRLAHAAEDLVGQLREGTRPVEPPVIDALLGALDRLRAITARAAEREPIDIPLQDAIARLRDPATTPAPESNQPVTESSATQDQAQELPSTEASRQRSPQRTATIRVDFDKLDLLMNLVGELVLGRDELHTALQSLGSLGNELASERQLARRLAKLQAQRRPSMALVGDGEATTNAADAQQSFNSGPSGDLPRSHELSSLSEDIGRVERVLIDVSQELDHASGRLDSISEQLRDQVMKLRLIPVGGTFRKHHRTVRDLANSLGKQARLELVGEETELDKVLVEMLDEPLMHLVRNAVDHGIETPAQRVAAGKPPEGTVRIAALHRGNQVIIEITDDGAGINPDTLRRKAVEKLLLTEQEAADLEPRQALELIFRPGFSTAQQVSEVSGRGVGMDVVCATIVNKLKGTVNIDSEIGAGSTLRLQLPLTLAIIQVLLARAGGEVFAIPLDPVIRTTTRSPDDVQYIQDREVIAVAKQQVPLVRLAEVLELGNEHYGDGRDLHVVLVDVAGDTYGLVCDGLLGKREIVIKSLGDLLPDVPCAAGATLLGDRCAIILDVPGIINRQLERAPAAPRVQPTGKSEVSPDHDAPHILIVEDSDVVREAIHRLLTQAGYRCTTATDGVEGLAAARAHTFDLISTDVMMPRMDGYELTRALRTLPAYLDAPIVMVTSRGERIDRVRGFDAGVDEYITKPHDRQLLLRVVQRLLASHAKEEQP